MLKKICRELINRWIILSNAKLRLHHGVNIRGSVFESYNSIGRNTTFIFSSIGIGSYIGSDCFFSRTIVGKYCSLGNEIKIVLGKHPSSDWISTHPSFFSTSNQAGFTFVSEQVYCELPICKNSDKYLIIGNDVWIGSRATLLGGITIGDGAIIAAGAVVVNNVPPYAIVGGVPAKIIKYRFTQPFINQLLDFQWWNKPFEWVQQKSLFFCKPDLFIKNCIKDDKKVEG